MSVKRWSNGDIFRDLVLSSDIGYTAPGPFVLAHDYDALHAKYENVVSILSQTESYVAQLEAKLRGT